MAPCHHLQGRQLEQIKFRDNAFAEALSPKHHHALEQRSKLKAGFYASDSNSRKLVPWPWIVSMQN